LQEIATIYPDHDGQVLTGLTSSWSNNIQRQVVLTHTPAELIDGATQRTSSHAFFAPTPFLVENYERSYAQTAKL
jgi:hypothetical protein